jgi:hypothetical protein
VLKVAHILYDECEFSHRYEYHTEARTPRVQMKSGDDEPRLRRFK